MLARMMNWRSPLKNKKKLNKKLNKKKEQRKKITKKVQMIITMNYKNKLRINKFLRLAVKVKSLICLKMINLAKIKKI